jgi:hypothetical protein
MMKKLLVMIVVLAVANLASAATIWPVADTVGGTQGGSIVAVPGATVKVYLAAAGGGNVPGGIVDMDLMVTAAGGTITAALNAADAPPAVGYGSWEAAPGAYIGGWDFPLNPIGLGTPAVEIGAGTVTQTIYDTTFPLYVAAPLIYTPVGYVDVLYPGGTVTVSLANATGLGGTTTHVIGAPITITPEPVTIGLLGLGGLALLRRRRA